MATNRNVSMEAVRVFCRSQPLSPFARGTRSLDNWMSVGIRMVAYLRDLNLGPARSIGYTGNAIGTASIQTVSVGDRSHPIKSLKNVSSIEAIGSYKKRVHLQM